MIRNTTIMLLCIIAASSLTPVYADLLSPLKQLQEGIAPQDIQCSQEKVLMLRGNDPACIMMSSTDALGERGWSIVAPVGDDTEITSSVDVLDMDILEPAYRSEHKGTHGNFKPAWPLVTVEYPDFVEYGDTFVMNYTYSYYQPNEDTEELEKIYDSDDGYADRYRDASSAFVTLSFPDEFALLTPHVTGHRPHEENTDEDVLYHVSTLLYQNNDRTPYYRLYMPYDASEKFFSGSIEFRLTDEKVNPVDMGLITYSYLGNDPLVLTDTGDGVAIERMPENFTWPQNVISIQDFYSAWETIPDVAGQSSTTTWDHDTYLPRDIWKLYAEFLDDERIDLGNIPEYLTAQGWEQEFIDDFLEEYPRFQTQGIDGAGGQATSPTHILISGQVSLGNASVSTPSQDVKACLFDVNTSTGVSPLQYSGVFPICDSSDSNGRFNLIALRSDPDNDGTNIDAQIQFSYDNDELIPIPSNVS